MKNIIKTDALKAYESIFLNLPYGVFFFDKNGIILGCNDVFLKSVNSTKELMIGFDAINMLQNELVVDAIKDCIKTGSGYYEGPYVSVTGAKKIISKGIFKAIYNKEQEFEIGLCTLEDITEQYQQKQDLIDLNNEYATLNEAFLEQNEELHRINDEVSKKNKILETEQIKNIDLLKNMSIAEQNYRTIFYNSATPMMMYQEGNIILTNDAFLKYAEADSKSKYIGKLAIDFIHEDYREQATKLVIESKNTNKATSLELKIVTPNELRDAIMNFAVIKYNNKESILISFIDITELKRETSKNIELLKSMSIAEQNYRTIFDNSPIPMIVHLKSNIVLINEAALSFGNINKREQVMGRSVLSFVHKSSHKTASENIGKVIKGENTDLQEEKFITLDGIVKDVIVNSAKFNYNGENALLVAFADISEIYESREEVNRVNEELQKKNDLLELETKTNKELLKKLSVTEKNYRTIFDHSPIPIVVHQDGEFVFLNDSSIDFIGGDSPEAYIGKSIKDFIDPSSFEQAKKNIENILKGNVTSLTEEKFIGKGNEARDVLVKSGPFIFNDKPAILAAFVDVTDIKKSEEKLRIITKGIESSPASVVITDKDGNIQYINPKFCEITGYTEEEVIGQNPRVLKSGFHNEDFYKSMWLTISKGEDWRGEICNQKKNGDLYWEYAIISSITNDKGDITNYIAIKEDITKRKEIEKQLIYKEKYFKTLYETAPDGIFEISAEGVITNCNIEFANSIGIGKSKLIGTKASHYIENKELFKKLFNRLKTKGFIESEVIQENADGTKTIVWRKVTSVYDKDGYFTGAIAYNREISEIKETEKQLILAKEKAEESDRLKSAFLSNMSHEIRTPLNAIIGFSELITKQNIQEIELSKYSEYIRHNSKVLLNLINDIIDVSKIEANQIKVVRSAVHLNNMFTELHQIFTEENKKNNGNVDLELSICDDNIIINSDEYRIRQIITNLVVNAIKFTQKGVITYGYYIKENNIFLFVKDTGQGISELFSSKIFDRFIKINKNNNNASGTGLGLSIVKSLTELLGGKIDVNSEENVGTEFIIKMPCDEIKMAEESKKEDKFEASSFDWSNKTILVAEDDEFNFIVLEESLKSSGINIIHAKDGIEAVELYKKNRNKIELVLMDIQMPRMNGYEATKELIKIDSEVKVIAQTAFAMADERNHSIEIGCVDYITKPIDIDTLTLLLANYLQ